MCPAGSAALAFSVATVADKELSAVYRTNPKLNTIEELLMRIRTAVFFIVIIPTLAFMPFIAKAESVPLDQIAHVHGLAVAPSALPRLYLATHSGLFAATPDGLATRVSNLNADFMSFAAVPENPKKYYASGHPPKGGNLGVMMSDDGGAAWRRISDGINGPVDFHALTVSPKDPNILYGVYQGVQMSRDGGVNWERTGDAPEKLFSLAASPGNTDTLYAATMKGLLKSTDRGSTWQVAYPGQRPATMVRVTSAGHVYAFIYGTGLITSLEPELKWETAATEFRDRFLIDLAVHPDDPKLLYALADTSAVMTSKDGGKTWYSFEGSAKATSEKLRAGARIYAESCQQCHGVGGIGERPKDMYAKDEFGFVAPPLNNDAHGWHHSDSQLVETILNGSPRNERMIAWKDLLSPQDAENVVVYIKSLWNFRSLACQGARHMACMR